MNCSPFLAVPPKEVKITGPTEAKVGDTVTLVCASSNSNPRAEMAWFKGGVALEDIHTNSVGSTDGGWATSSNVTFKIEPNDRKESYTCQAVNRGLGESKSSTHTINVIRKEVSIKSISTLASWVFLQSINDGLVTT